MKHATSDSSSLIAALCQALRARRQFLGLTQAEVGRRAHLNRSYINDLEKGSRNLTLGSLCRLEEAAIELTNALDIDPNLSSAYSGLGMVKLAQGELSAAAGNLQQAIALNSGNSSAHYGLGEVYVRLGHYDQAIKELNTSLYQFPNSWPVHFALGRAYQAQGNSDAALREFQQAALIKPEIPDVYVRMADIHQSRGDLEHAVADLRSAAALLPKDTDLKIRMADASLQLGKFKDAIADYNAVLALSPNNALAVKGLTQALYMKSQNQAASAMFASNDYEGALNSLTEAIALNPNDMELRLAQMKMQSIAGTEPDLSKVATPRNDGDRILYARALMAADRFTDESMQMTAVINSSASDLKQLLAAGDMAVMMQDFDSAKLAYSKALGMPGGEDRAKRGLAMVSKAHAQADQDFRLATDLLRRHQIDSAVDRYRRAVA